MVNKLVLGTVQFGLNYGINNFLDKPSVSQVFEMLDLAFDNDISTLDTADAYGDASQLIGKYNSKYPKKFLINTKFNASISKLAVQLEKSLIKLNTDFINIYFYHNFNDFINYPDIQVQLLKLKESGKIQKIGLSVYENEEIKQACESVLIDVIQLPFNLLDNNSQRGNLIKSAKMIGKEVQVRSIFLQGLFFKLLNELTPKLFPLKPHLKKIHEIAKYSRISIEQLALNYALQHKDIDNVIIGVDSIQQLIIDIEMAKNKISNEEIEAVNQILVQEVKLLNPKNW
ncbi:aldo/keto reductase [Bacteroidota bacterium]